MKNSISSPRQFIDKLFARLGLGMRAKLIVLFVVIKVVPLVLLAFVALRYSWQLGEELRQRTHDLTLTANKALLKTGDIAAHDAVKALDERAREDIERMTTDTALRVANFLYSRDYDIRLVSALKPSSEAYLNFIENQRGHIVRPVQWELAPDGKSWQMADSPAPAKEIVSSIAENSTSFHYRNPEGYEYESRPLYLEITFVDPQGHERIKVTSSTRVDKELKDISQPKNTFIGAERYFSELKKLKPGEIYVSDVIGAYVGSRVIGTYTPAAASKAGEPYAPELSAYAGKENPLGKRFEGLVRWATPVLENGKIIGYVTLALDHDHLMEFTSHLMPTSERYTIIPDASEGNYAFIWDHKGRSIVHPRHFSIVGYDPQTGDPQIPWLEDRIYNEWKQSGKSYVDFIEDVPTFFEQSNHKKPAPELTKQGLVGLDCRYLNFAAQCTGWFDLTQDGGSGSFLILWSNLWKLNTAAAIPYYTGQYAASPRGFGFVAIGAGVDDFHRPATETKKVIDDLIAVSDAALAEKAEETQQAINKNLFDTASSLSISTAIMGILVVLVAIWMASVFTKSITKLIDGISRFRSGERQFRFKAPVKDELGTLADSFDDMADSLVDSVKGPLVITDINRNVIYINEDGLDKLGKTLPETQGKPYAENSIFPTNTKYCPITSLLAGRESEVFYHAATGRYYKGTATFFRNKDGESIGYVINSTDVSEIVKEQKKTEEQRALLATIFSSSPDLIWYKDAQGRFLAVNPRFAAVVGKEERNIVNRTVDEILAPDFAAAFKANDSMAIAEGIPMYTEEKITFADGHAEVVDSVRTPIFDSEGALVGMLGVSRDVSGRVTVENELRDTQLELKKAVREANKANESKSEFLARMSHEIRTPMNAIIGMTNIAKRKLGNEVCDTGEVQSHVCQIEVSSHHLLGLINDILDISKIEAGKIELSEEAFDLSKLMDSVSAIMKPRCVEKKIEFDISMGPFDTHLFISDPLRLRQVLINLLGNAVKFTSEYGRVECRLVQKERKGDQTLVGFSVIDTGIGISEQAMATLFTPFEQGSNEITKQYGGTGLGLSISKNIINIMGGEIVVSSKQGEGSTFSFDLWLTENANNADAIDVIDHSVSLQGKRLLLVDDVEVNRMIVKELLSTAGLIIDEAEDGLVAVEKFRNSAEGFYGIILMDVQMPRMDGYQAATMIRSLPRPDSGVPIIALTANAFKEDVDKAIACGMNAHLSKPLEYDKLMDILFKHLGGTSSH